MPARCSRSPQRSRGSAQLAERAARSARASLSPFPCGKSPPRVLRALTRWLAAGGGELAVSCAGSPWRCLLPPRLCVGDSVSWCCSERLASFRMANWGWGGRTELVSRIVCSNGSEERKMAKSSLNAMAGSSSSFSSAAILTWPWCCSRELACCCCFS